MAPKRGRGQYAEKPANFGKSVVRLIKDFKGQAFVLILVMFLSVASVACQILSPIVLKTITNNLLNVGELGSFVTIEGKVVWDSLFMEFGKILALYLSAALLGWATEFIVVKISGNYAYNMRQRVKEKLDRLPLSYFDHQTIGEILSRGTSDVDNISRNMSNMVTQTVSGITMFVGVIIAMFITNWKLALVAIATVPLTFAIAICIAVFSQKQFRKFRNETGELNGIIEEAYSGVKIIKLFNREDDVQKDFDAVNEKLAKSDRKAHWISSLIFPCMRFINNVGFVGVCIAGGAFDVVGDMVAFFLFLNLFQQPFQMLGEISSIIQSSVASAERIFALLDEKELVPDNETMVQTEDNIKGKIDFNHVDFSYSAEKELITDMNLHIQPGDSIAIVGPTGAGKTTIVNLIMRFYEVNKGNIELDGIDTRNYTYAALRGSVGMVLQDTWLFHGTIKDNIKYGNKDASDEEVARAAKEAHADHFIETLPGGYDFMLNEDGTNISQGQRQLLTIARAIISKPKIMILDEATSSVDTRTELAIQDAMNKMMIGRTSFIIAHRLSTIKNAKIILVMNKGKIVEMGSHNDLIKQNGFYAELYNAQFLGKSLEENEQIIEPVKA